MPIVQVSLLAGRSNEVRQALAEQLTKAVVESLQVSPASVRVLLYQVEREDWFVGGQPIGTSQTAGPASSEPEAGHRA